MRGVFSTLVALCLICLIQANPHPVEKWEEDAHQVLIRNTRGADKGKDSACKYDKAAWSECDPVSHMKNRTLTLKKGNPATCEATKTISRKCKKACRYEKGAWSQCSATGEMTRTELLKEANSDANCEKSRTTTKKCKSKNRKNKGTKFGSRQ